MNKIIITNATLLLPTGEIKENAYLIIQNGLIDDMGEMDNFSHPVNDADELIDASKRLITPSLIDCHTHVVYAGDRSKEFERRLTGVSYSQIAKEGGGIQSTVSATRKASFDELFEQSYPRALAMKEFGVGTIEIKSGYGLDLATELKMLTVAKKLGEDLNLRIKSTFLGAHALPHEYKNRSDDYVDLVCKEMLPKVSELSLADSVDVFCDSIGFNLEQTEKVFETAREFGFNIKCHAEQLSNLGASKLASSLGAVSCDHLEYVDENAINAMRQNSTIAVLLPGAYYFLRETKKPPVEKLRQYGVNIAIATDSNPGSSPTVSLPLMMNMATVLFSLTVNEAWLGVTKNAAKALKLEQDVGSLEKGKKAEIVIWDCDNLSSMCYGFGQIKPWRQIA